MRALLLIDLQNDFLPGGALAVTDGDKVLPIANTLQERFDLIVATQDWHPPQHQSFASTQPGKKPGDRIDLHGLPQVLWPVHCVQQTRGAAFAPALDTSRVTEVFQKGTDPEIDSYSGLFDNGHRKSTGLGEYLKAQHVTEVYVLGLATDYCVKFTALDARQMGFNVFLIEDACRGVNLSPNDSRDAIEEMRRAGVMITQSSDVAILA